MQDNTLNRGPTAGTAARRALALLVLAVAPPFISPASGSPRAIVADYFNNGTIDYAYSIDDLRGALVFARRHQRSGVQYAAFADAVNQAITDSLVGAGDAAQQQLTTPRSRTEVAPPPQPAPAPIPSNLPTPPQGSPAESIPWVVPTMAIIAGILVLAGIGSSVWRRVRR